jgi:hypothetical protein
MKFLDNQWQLMQHPLSAQLWFWWLSHCICLCIDSILIADGFYNLIGYDKPDWLLNPSVVFIEFRRAIGNSHVLVLSM